MIGIKEIFKTHDPLDRTGRLGCWDPVIWFDERDQKYYAMGACGHNVGGHPGGMTGIGGYGLQQLFRSDDWKTGWEQLSAPFLETHTETVPKVGTWNRTHEFVTPDFFPLPADSTANKASDGAGAGAGADLWAFLTTTYGGMMQTGLNKTAADGVREYDYSNYLIGPRPPPRRAVCVSAHAAILHVAFTDVSLRIRTA